MIERLGIFGGTFDPIHNGHLVAALAALTELELDRVLMVVAADPWQKRGRVVGDAATRLELVAAACASVDGLEASDIEIERGGPSFSIDTVEALQRPDREMVLILGADAAQRVGSWHRADELALLVTVAVVGRPASVASPTDESVWRFRSVSMPLLEISSTDIRDRIHRRAPIHGLVPEAVVHLIQAKSLYTS